MSIGRDPRKLVERSRWWLLYLSLGALLIVLYYLVPPFKGSGVLFNLIGLSSSIAIFVGIKLHRPKARLAWYLFAVGQLFFVSGDAFYYGYDAIFHKDVPFPSPADFFYLAVYPALIAGLLIIIRRRNPSGDRPSLIDALILTTGLGLLSWVFLMAPYAHDVTLSLLEKVVSIAYPLMDICLLAVAIRLAVGSGPTRPSLKLLILSIVSLLTADSILGLLTLQGGYQEGGLLDAGWAIYYLLWGAAALHPSMRSLDEATKATAAKLGRTRLALLTGASLMAPAVRAIQALRGEDVDVSVMVTSSAALFLLVVARMVGLLRESERSTAREKTLREAARALVTARSREEVYQAALDSMLTLAGPEHFARLCVIHPSGELRARGWDAGRQREWTVRASDLTSLDAKGLRDSRALEVDLPEGLRTALRLPDQVSVAMAFPLFVSQELRGLLFIAGSEDFAPQVKDSMQTLAVQIALAQESAILTEDLVRRESEARFRSLVQHSSDLITVIDAEATITYQSPSVERVLGYDADELVGRNFAELIHPHEAHRITPLLVDDIVSAHPQVEVVECRLKHANGSWLLFEIYRTNLQHDPNVAGIVLNSRDISERKEFEQQLAHQAFHDSVTDLANRALFSNRVEHALSRQTREASGLGVIFVDLDDFKIINDSLGHAAGDEVLREVGHRLGRCVRPMDTVARFGGDEFAILVEDTYHPEAVVEVADRVLESLQSPIAVEGKEVFIRASVGIAMLDGEEAMTSAAEDLMRNADVAMYRAKREGKGHYRLFEPEMHADVLGRLELKGALQRAIERGEMRLHYQPVVELPSLKILGLEALVRWQHPERGLVSPGDFIPLAEETGLIVPLGNWVLNEACKQAKFLQDMVASSDPLTMSVNVSVKQLHQKDLVGTINQALSDSGLDPSLLMLEITESVLMIDTDATIAKLHELKELGIRLAVDDFGTGYSSLSYLSRFPVDVLKIDRSFVSQVHANGQGSALAAAIVSLGETLKLQTVAEGIERPAQLNRFVELGCMMAQGFLVAKPMDIDGTLEFLRPSLGGEVSSEIIPGD
jgi:diguanylate cyclase (GGDEF)-like protein/PAS domain S-box-containing protein